MTQIVLGLSAVVVAVTEDAPLVLVTRARADALSGLPFGLFDPAGDRTLELTLRKWVSAQTGFEIGYVEQLYTFGDRGREAPLAVDADRVLSIGYLALAPEKSDLREAGADWRDWYRYFPWEDWRAGRPDVIDAVIAPRELRYWCDQQLRRPLHARRVLLQNLHPPARLLETHFRTRHPPSRWPWQSPQRPRRRPL